MHSLFLVPQSCMFRHYCTDVARILMITTPSLPNYEFINEHAIYATDCIKQALPA